MTKILIIEDDIISAESLQINLADNGFNVYYALNELDGMSLLKEILPDILLLDINLSSENDGIYLAKMVLKVKPDLKIIFTTGYTKASYSKELEDISYLAYLEKPVDYKELLSIISELN